MELWFRKARMATLVVVSLLITTCGPPEGPPQLRTDFKIGWSIYAGWMPWPYAQQAGIVKKWADKYGIKIEMVQVNDYVESVNQYTIGKLDGVTITNMDALTIPAAGGRDTSAIIIGDYSNGNDGVLVKNASSLKDIQGHSINLAELSVSHYLLGRALESVSLSFKDVNTVNTADADIVGAFAASDVTAAVAWNPQLNEMEKATGGTLVFDSSDIPGEILDLLVIDTAILKANPNLGKALVGIWYETMALMQRKDARGKAARTAMAKFSGSTLESFEAQLSTTYLYATPKDALAAAFAPELAVAMARVRDFSFSMGLFGPSATSPDAIGIAFPKGRVLGNPNNVKMRFDSTFMQLALDKKL